MDAKWHAHRLAWVLVHGDIPDGLAIGHARDQGYRFPNYIRIDHLSAVIPAESMRRWMPPTAVSARTGRVGAACTP